MRGGNRVHLLTFYQDIHVFPQSNKKVATNKGGQVSITSLEWSKQGREQIPSLTPYPDLEYLDLSSNRIRDIFGVKFPSSLRFLRLDYNKIEIVTLVTFINPTANELRNLYLDQNPIHHITEDAFKHLKQLVELSLTQTNLRRLPMALAKLDNPNPAAEMTINLNRLYMFLCMCEDSLLKDWYQTVRSSGRGINVQGTCYRGLNGASTYINTWLAEPRC